MEWPGVLRLASEHGIRPLLYRSLNAICPDIVPEAVLEELRSFVHTDVACNLFQNAELLRVLEGLKARGISAIPFKGAVLESWAYGEPSLRESGDLDIVIRRRNLREALAFLLAHDYRPHARELHEAILDMDHDHFGRYLRLDHTDGLVSIDLQTSLEAPHFSFSLDVDELWDRAISRRFADQTVLSFSAEDLLILLCVHGTKDVWLKLKWICDVAEFIGRDNQINWGNVLFQATHLRARRKLLLGCCLAHELLGAHLPDDILSCIHGEPIVKAAAETIISRLSHGEHTVTHSERATLYFRTEDTSDRVRRGLDYVRRTLAALVVPSENDRRFLSLPRWLSSAYYLVRPIRLMAQYGARPRRAMRESRELLESLD
jgi:hypothetical protein